MNNIRTVQAMTSACSAARDDLRLFIRRNWEMREMRWQADREPRVLIIGADGERLADDGWIRWDRRRSTVDEILRQHPDAQALVVEGGINVAMNKADLDAGNYEPLIWQANIWNRNDPTPEQGRELTALLRRRTAFQSFDDMFAAKGEYRPSMDVSDSEMRRLADHYDHLAEQRGEERRAFRYGQDRQRQVKYSSQALAGAILANVFRDSACDEELTGEQVHDIMAAGSADQHFEPNTGGGIWLSHSLHATEEGLVHVVAGADSVAVYKALAPTAEAASLAWYDRCGEEDDIKLAEYFWEADAPSAKP